MGERLNSDMNIYFDKIHTYAFRFENSYYLYDYFYDLVLRITKSMYECFQLIINNDNVSATYDKEYTIISSFMKHGLLISEYNLPCPVNDTAYLSFAPVYNCNFRCKYCFGSHGESYKGTEKKFTSDTMKKAIDFFIHKAFPNKKYYRIDFVSGGEPLLNFDIVKQTIEYVEQIQREQNKVIVVWLCTNGSLLSDEICSYLSEHNISIGISLDGEKYCNDLMRVDQFGKGTYDNVVRNIKNILYSDKYSNKFKNIWALSVINQNNNNMIDIVKHHANLGIKNLQMKLVRSQNTDEVYISSYHNLALYMYEQFKEGNIDILRMIINNNDYFGKILKRIILHQTVNRRCYAGMNKITICPDGTVYPCDSFVGHDKYCIGNINELNEIQTDFANQTVDNRRKCYKCLARYICGGDCYFNSYIVNKTIEEPSENFCRIQKEIINSCIILRTKMETFDQKKYEELREELLLREGFSK